MLLTTPTCEEMESFRLEFLEKHVYDDRKMYGSPLLIAPENKSFRAEQERRPQLPGASLSARGTELTGVLPSLLPQQALQPGENLSAALRHGVIPSAATPQQLGESLSAGDPWGWTCIGGSSR